MKNRESIQLNKINSPREQEATLCYAKPQLLSTPLRYGECDDGLTLGDGNCDFGRYD